LAQLLAQVRCTWERRAMAEGILVPHMPKALLSEEAMRVITSLQAQLKRTHWKVQAAEHAAEKALDDAEERGVQMDARYDRQQEVERSLKRLKEEHDEDTKHEDRLTKHLTELQEELLETRSRMEHQIPMEEIEALRGELQEMRTRLAQAEKEGQELRVQLAQVEEARRKRARRPTPESVGIRQAAGHERGCRMSEARQCSARAVSEQKERDTKIQVERIVQLTRQKERLEAEWHQCCAENAEREKVLEDMRCRNKKLEAARRRCREANEEQEAVLHEETRKHQRQIQVLRSLLDSDGVLGSNGISGSHRNNFVIDELTSDAPDGSRNVRTQLAQRTETVLTDRGCSAGTTGSASGGLAPAAVADAKRTLATPDDERYLSASICLWADSTHPTRATSSQSGSTAIRHDTGDLIVEQDPASWEQGCMSPQEGIERSLGRLDAANSRTHGLLGEVRDWCHELGNSPVDGSISNSVELEKVSKRRTEGASEELAAILDQRNRRIEEVSGLHFHVDETADSYGSA